MDIVKGIIGWIIIGFVAYIFFNLPDTDSNTEEEFKIVGKWISTDSKPLPKSYLTVISINEEIDLVMVEAWAKTDSAVFYFHEDGVYSSELWFQLPQKRLGMTIPVTYKQVLHGDWDYWLGDIRVTNIVSPNDEFQGLKNEEIQDLMEGRLKYKSISDNEILIDIWGNDDQAYWIHLKKAI